MASSFAFACSCISSTLTVAGFFASLILIIMGSKEYSDLNDVVVWEPAECYPRHSTIEGECCYKREEHCVVVGEIETNCTSTCIEYGELVWEWMVVQTEDQCEDGIVRRQSEHNCQKKSFETNWPDGSEEPVDCFTNCHEYEISHEPHDQLIRARTLTIVGYLCVLLPGIFSLLYYGYTSYEDMSKQERKRYYGSIFGFFYAVFWTSITNCTFSISGQCNEITAGYSILSLSPIVVFIVWIHCIAYPNLQYLAPYILTFLSFVGVGLLVIAISLGRCERSCFKISWCEFHMYISVGVHFLAFGVIFLNEKFGCCEPIFECCLSILGCCKSTFGYCPSMCCTPLLNQYKQYYVRKKYEQRQKEHEQKKKNLAEKENEERLQVLEALERRWSGQKDVIMPWIDHRDHIWNEIWTMCWDMEQYFFNEEMSLYRPRFCDLLLASKSISHISNNFSAYELTALGRKKWCCGNRPTKTVKTIAESIGEIEWKVRASSFVVLELDYAEEPERERYRQQQYWGVENDYNNIEALYLQPRYE